MILARRELEYNQVNWLKILIEYFSVVIWYVMCIGRLYEVLDTVFLSGSILQEAKIFLCQTL